MELACVFGLFRDWIIFTLWTEHGLDQVLVGAFLAKDNTCCPCWPKPFYIVGAESQAVYRPGVTMLARKGHVSTRGLWVRGRVRTVGCGDCENLGCLDRVRRAEELSDVQAGRGVFVESTFVSVTLWVCVIETSIVGGFFFSRLSITRYTVV